MKTETDLTKILKPDFDRPVEGYRYRNGRKFKCLSVRAAGRGPIITQDVTTKLLFWHFRCGRLFLSSRDEPLDIVPLEEAAAQQ